MPGLLSIIVGLVIMVLAWSFATRHSLRRRMLPHFTEQSLQRIESARVHVWLGVALCATGLMFVALGIVSLTV
jgi:hypothetical protein